uniref:YncE family protein n=1 Tax=Pseudoalteromonas sp. (strain SANK 73390) TaxID=747457 RepID=UPI001D140EE7|nr:YncE family protein [Pseudoalteromonas sp. SANK 73390]
MTLLVPATAWSAATNQTDKPDFIGFESGPVRPLAISPDGKRLFVTNIPDNRLEIFDITHTTPRPIGSVTVGMEPVAVEVLNNDIVYVANHLSDSVSVVNVTNPDKAYVSKTLLVGDEPRDIVVTDPDGSGPSAPRLFVATGHRGQHRADPSIASVPGAGDPQLTTAGVGRADVWVFDSHNLGNEVGGKPIKIMSFFSDSPRALAVSNDGKQVYVAAHFSQNRTALVNNFTVCDGFVYAEPCETMDGKASPNGPINEDGNGILPGGLLAPLANIEGFKAPETSLIVQFDPNAGPADNDLNTGQFVDEKGRNWSNGVRMHLPDKDVFVIDAQRLQKLAFHQSVGTTLYNMAVNPRTDVLYVSNTEAQNMTRFVGEGLHGKSLRGHIAESRITVITSADVYDKSGNNVIPRHLNKHIDYTQHVAPATVKAKSLATPLQMVVSQDGQTLYVAAFGSQVIGTFDTTELENDTFIPNAAAHIKLSAGGPGGLVMANNDDILYVYTRFDNGISVVDTKKKQEVAHIAMFNPEPESIIKGRPYLYDAKLTSSNGEASCASCHIFGDHDFLAWDLGDPNDKVKNSSLPINLREFFEFAATLDPAGAKRLEALNGDAQVNQFHPLKGPLLTQTLRGISTHGAMHWRGDKLNGMFTSDPENPTLEDAFDETLSFINFSSGFVSLNGMENPLSEEQMIEFWQFIKVLYLPPNPVRNIDNSLTASQQNGRDFFFGLKENVTMPDGTEITVTRRAEFLSELDNILLNQSTGLDIVGGFSCDGCHTLDPAKGFFGTNGRQNMEEPQILKIPHLRNLANRVGAFGIVPNEDVNMHTVPDPSVFDFQGDQIKGFGFLKDGGIDTMSNFFGSSRFFDTGKGTGFQTRQQRLDIEQYMFVFPGDLAPIVGQQVTVNHYTDAALKRVELLLERANEPFVSKTLGGETKEADVVAKCLVQGKQRGFLFNRYGLFTSDRGFPFLTSGLVFLICDGPVTFTAVPPGSGYRVGIDRDADGQLDGFDWHNTPTKTKGP